MLSLAVFWWFTARGAGELLLRLLLLLVNSPLLPVSSVGDLLAVTVRTVLITSNNHVVVPAVPALLLLLHVTVAPRLLGDWRGRGLALLAEGEGILVLPAHRDDGLVLAAVWAAGGGRAGVCVHGHHGLRVLGALRGGGVWARWRVGSRGGGRGGRRAGIAGQGLHWQWRALVTVQHAVQLAVVAHHVVHSVLHLQQHPLLFPLWYAAKSDSWG